MIFMKRGKNSAKNWAIFSIPLNKSCLKGFVEDISVGINTYCLRICFSQGHKSASFFYSRGHVLTLYYQSLLIIIGAARCGVRGSAHVHESLDTTAAVNDQKRRQNSLDIYVNPFETLETCIVAMIT